jgi:hypothetical protein
MKRLLQLRNDTRGSYVVQLLATGSISMARPEDAADSSASHDRLSALNLHKDDTPGAVTSRGAVPVGWQRR